MPSTNLTGGLGGSDFYVNPTDNVDGFVVNGTLPVSNDQGVHSLTDVPVFAMGPCQELFAGEYNIFIAIFCWVSGLMLTVSTGVYNNIDIFFNMAECLGLGRSSNATGKVKGY